MMKKCYTITIIIDDDEGYYEKEFWREAESYEEAEQRAQHIIDTFYPDEDIVDVIIDPC